MKLRLLDAFSEPGGGFTYIGPDTGYQTKGNTLNQLVEKARLHREANGLPVADDFSALVETQICKRLPDTLCTATDGVRDTSCKYRGPVVRKEICGSCGGKVTALIKACQIHGECTEFTKEVGVKPCWHCSDRTPLTS